MRARRAIPLLVLVLIAPAATLQSASASPAAQILVGFDRSTSASVRASLIAQVGGRRLSTLRPLGVVVVSVPPARSDAALAELERRPGVDYAEVNGAVHADDVVVNDPLLNSSSWQLANPHFPDAWSLTTGSANVTVAVVDTGVEPGHEDLGTLVAGQSFAPGSTDPTNTIDDNGHGTAVAGIIAGQGNNGKGIAGICWSCRIMPVKVLDSDGDGTDQSVALGMIWATDHGARVINLSLSGSDASATLDAAAAYAESKGVVVVAAAGNDDSSRPEYPAASPGVLSVGAVDKNDVRYSSTQYGNTTEMRWGSNYGDWVKVDAPGCTDTTARNDSYWVGDSFCGTSAATPFVSGLAGLAFSYAPTVTASGLENSIEQTAQPLTDGSSYYGLIDAPATLLSLGSAPTGPLASFEPSATSGFAPLSVTFTNTSVNATSFAWAFGDGTGSTATSPVHSFGAGTYQVTLTAMNGGDTTLASTTITVKALPPQASFSAGALSGLAPFTVTFKNSSQNAVSYLWSFGDGTPSSSEASPQHTFTSPGRFAVILTATGPGGSATKSSIVTVAARPDLTLRLARTSTSRRGRRQLASLLVTLGNRGLAADGGVRLRITLPVSSSIKKFTIGGRGCVAAGRRINCSLGTIAAKKSLHIGVVASLLNGTLTLASVSGAKVETTLSNNSASLRTR